MDHYKLVLPEHLNHYGNLFGGNMLKWIDEFSYITANLEFTGHQFLTIALDNVVFRQGVNNGEILKFSITRNHLGKTSVQYKVQVFGTRNHPQTNVILFETKITFVSVDKEGKKREIQSSDLSIESSLNLK